MQEVDQEDSSESLTPPSEEGYAITVQVFPSGFLVNGAQHPDESSMLKAVLKLARNHAHSDEAVTQLRAGFESE